MKEAFLIIAFISVFFCVLNAQTITVTHPAAGEFWAVGQTQSITWTPSGNMGARVAIRLRQGNAVVLVISANTDNDGEFSWTLPSSITPGQYYIRVWTLDDAATGDSGLFMVVPHAPLFVVNAPQGGESWEENSTKQIRWMIQNYSGLVRLALLNAGSAIGVIAENIDSKVGQADWVVGTLDSGTAPAGHDYKVRVESMDGRYGDNSDNPFTIASPPITFAPIRPVEVHILAKKPDLVVCLNWGSDVPMIYQDLRIHVRVKNHGQGDAPASTLRVYVKQNGVHYIPVPALAPQAVFEWSEKFHWGTCGHKVVRAWADYYGKVAESKEDNNFIEYKTMVDCGQTAYQVVPDSCSDQSPF